MWNKRAVEEAVDVAPQTQCVIMNSKSAKPKAILFYSRSFLAKFMPRALGPLAANHRLLFLCNNNRESRWIQENARHIQESISIYKFRPLTSVEARSSDLYWEIFSGLVDEKLLKAPDRYIEQQNHGARVQLIQDVSTILSEILESYEIVLYVDEPVANLYNYYISHSLRLKSIATIHFQAVFGGHGFFLTKDIAETKPIPLSLIDIQSRFPSASIVELVDHTFPQSCHLSRSERYIYSYSRKRSLFFSLLRNIAKLSVRYARGAINPSGYTYLDTETSSTAFHVQCLIRALLFRGDTYVDLSRDSSCLDAAIVIPLHFEPENICMYLSPYFQSQVQMILAVITMRAEASCPIYIKEHPSQPGALLTPRYSWLRNIPNVHLIRSTARIEALITNKTTIVSLGSSLCIHALLRGSSVILAGSSYISGLPGATYCDTIGSFKAAMKQALSNNRPMQDTTGPDVLIALQQFARDYVFEASIDTSSHADEQGAFLSVVKRISESPQHFVYDELKLEKSL